VRTITIISETQTRFLLLTRQTELPTCLLCPALLEFASIACCSATKDVVTLSSGTLNSLDTRLKTDMDTPTAASSTEPGDRIREREMNTYFLFLNIQYETING
jgi:hypothetical protein